MISEAAFTFGGIVVGLLVSQFSLGRRFGDRLVRVETLIGGFGDELTRLRGTVDGIAETLQRQGG